MFSQKMGGGLLCSLILCLYFPSQAQSDSTQVIKDFNGDQYPDTLLIYYDGGGSFGGWFCELREGKRGTVFEVDTWSDFGSIYQVTPVPPELKKRKYRDFLATIKNAIFPEELPEPDPSLAWIIQANLSPKDTFAQGPYSRLFSYIPTWVSGEVDIPEAYFLSISGDILKQLYHPPLDAPEWYQPETVSGWLVYYAQNHNREKIAVMDTRDSVDLKATSHGVLLTHQDRYQWLFITDGYLTRGPEKLRWPSINKAVFFKDLVIIEQALAPHLVVNYFVIDPATGRCGQVDTEFLWGSGIKNINMEITEDGFWIRWDGEGAKGFAHEELKEGLEGKGRENEKQELKK
jgi:hypothetical protein